VNFNTPGYQRSRWAYTIECAFEYFIMLMVADAFLATLLSQMGLSDAVIGVISSLTSFAFLFQLFSILVVQHIHNIKLVAVPIHCVSQLFFLVLYLLPFLNIPAQFRTAVIVSCLLIAYFGNYLATSVIFNWGNSSVDPKSRANFAATKEIISLISGVVVSLTIGWVFDGFVAAGDINGAFLFIAAMMLLMNIGDFICLMLMKNRKTEKRDADPIEPFGQVIRMLFSNRGFVCSVVVHSMWSISAYMTIGFMGTYKTKELLLSVGAVQIINIVACLLRALFSKPIAHYADQHSYAKGIRLGMIIAAAGYLVNMFTTPSLWWLVILYTVLYNIACAGTTQNLLNIVYNYVDLKYFVQASAIKYSISGLCGFGASVLASRILGAVQANENTFLGISLYGQQLLSAISFALLIISILFVKFVVEKQKIIAK
ncbi:MAG: MFS transporter, partial [Clostridia bacterium]|nr:MFS transporter [Clostridia bacterium]